MMDKTPTDLFERKINVLDHGFVRLHKHMGDDLEVVRVARQSYDAAWRTGEDAGKDERLIRYLMRNKHTSPFEAVEFMFEVSVPIMVERQWRRHRSWTYFGVNEVSARYTELPAKFYIPDPEHVGTQSATNKQGRDLNVNVPIKKRASEVAAYRSRCEAAFREYQWMIEQGWPREVARNVLPLATYTHMFVKADLHNLLHFLDLRSHEHAMFEMREYADALKTLVEPVVPVCMAAWYESLADTGDESGMAVKIKSIIDKLTGDHADRLYLSKDYTKADLRRELLAAIGAA